MISFLRLKDSFQPQPASLGRPHRGESDMVELIISLIAGAVGGNAAAKIFNSIDMGVVENSIAGIVGGGIGGPLLPALLGGSGLRETAWCAAGGFDPVPVVGHSARVGVSGGSHRVVLTRPARAARQ